MQASRIRRLLAGAPAILTLAFAGDALAAAPTFRAPVGFPAGADPTHIAHGDFDGDGRPDFAVTNTLASRVTILGSAEGGTLQERAAIEVEGRPAHVAVTELNGDGDADLVVANLISRDVAVLLGGPGAGFVPAGRFDGGRGMAAGVAPADFNADGLVDLAVPGSGFHTVNVLLGEPGRTFSAPTEYPVGQQPVSLAVADFNDDRDPDIATANLTSDDVSVLVGGPGGGFVEAERLPAGEGPFSIAAARLDEDPDPDLVTANIVSGDVSIFAGGPGATFAAPLNQPSNPNPRSLVVGEVNGDGDLDAALTNSNEGLSLLFGAPGVGFEGARFLRTGEDPRAVAIADVNGDAETDVVATAPGSDRVLVLLENDPPDCSRVTISPDALNPPNHKLVPVKLAGATDPDGDPLTVKVTRVTQDEPVADPDRPGPDAALGTAPLLRAERSDAGDGRVYRVAYEVSDGAATCTGIVKVGVRRGAGAAVDGGDTTSFDSVTGEPVG